jgi:hypothetical protein
MTIQYVQFEKFGGKEPVVYFKVLSQHSPGDVGEIMKNFGTAGSENEIGI